MGGGPPLAFDLVQARGLAGDELPAGFAFGPDVENAELEGAGFGAEEADGGLLAEDGGVAGEGDLTVFAVDDAAVLGGLLNGEGFDDFPLVFEAAVGMGVDELVAEELFKGGGVGLHHRLGELGHGGIDFSLALVGGEEGESEEDKE